MGLRSKPRPWPCEADDAVPEGRFGEYRAAICEGFCPACRIPFDGGEPTGDAVRGSCHGLPDGSPCKGPDGGYGVHWLYHRDSDTIEWTSHGLEGWGSITMWVHNLDERTD